jgi:hypothetical protein
VVIRDFQNARIAGIRFATWLLTHRPTFKELKAVYPQHFKTSPISLIGLLMRGTGKLLAVRATMISTRPNSEIS